MMPFEIAEPSWSTSRIGILTTSSSERCPLKRNPKNDPMAMGIAKAMMTARRSLRKICRSLRIMARIGVRDISRAGSCR
jgi:hypothetical protein